MASSFLRNLKSWAQTDICNKQWSQSITWCLLSVYWVKPELWLTTEMCNAKEAAQLGGMKGTCSDIAKTWDMLPNMVKILIINEHLSCMSHIPLQSAAPRVSSLKVWSGVAPELSPDSKKSIPTEKMAVSGDRLYVA